MTVAELIKELEKMPQDATVAVKYRDDGGSYSGCDYDVEPWVNEPCFAKYNRDPVGIVLI